MRAIVCLAVRFGVAPSVVLQMSETDFFYCLAALKLEADDRRNSRN
jgi:hypothetical protein